MRRASSWPKPGDNGMRMKEFRDGVDDRTTRKGDIETETSDSGLARHDGVGPRCEVRANEAR